MSDARRIGVLTSGGDAPGMNPCIRAVVRAGIARGLTVFGIKEGFEGLRRGDVRELRARDVGNIVQHGGTMLHTARCAEMHEPAGRRQLVRRVSEADLDALVVIGGDGSLRGAHALAELGVRVVGVPASIDNDIWGTNMAIGVDTALNTIMDAVDKLRDTASSHQRAFLVETMGRSSGYLALMAGLVCGADVILVPEVDTTLEEVEATIEAAYSRGKSHALIVIAEGAKLGSHEVAGFLADRDVGFESRLTILGHVQRGGRPGAFDRMLASRLGYAAVEALAAGENDVMVALQGREIATIPLEEVARHQREANLDYYEIAQTLAR